MYAQRFESLTSLLVKEHTINKAAAARQLKKKNQIGFAVSIV
jgi:hypothetical protein